MTARAPSDADEELAAATRELDVALEELRRVLRQGSVDPEAARRALDAAERKLLAARKRVAQLRARAARNEED